VATERNPAGEEGAGLSGMGSSGYGSGLGGAGSTGSSGLTGGTRDDASLDTGTGSRAMGDLGAGTGEVHSGLSMGRDVETGYGAIAPAGTSAGSSWEPSGGSAEGGAMNRVRDVAGQARERLQGLSGNVSGRMGDAAGQAREKAGEALGRAEQVLEERGILDKVRENPLPALGLAFGVGFLLAGSGDQVQGKRSTALYKARNQLKGAIMGGLSAAVAQEGRNLLGMAQGKGNPGGLLGTLLQNLQGGGTGGAGASGESAPHRRPSHQETR
jgi:ElaB/YqjD/DUF883 family membrane-anchored ribosome-binding protein